MITGSEQFVAIHDGGTSIIASPSFRDKRAAQWLIKAAGVVIDHVELFVAKQGKFFYTSVTLFWRILLSFVIL